MYHDADYCIRYLHRRFLVGLDRFICIQQSGTSILNHFSHLAGLPSCVCFLGVVQLCLGTLTGWAVVCTVTTQSCSSNFSSIHTE